MSLAQPETPLEARRLRAGALAFLAYLALTLAYFRPTWRQLTGAIVPDPGDPVLVLSLLKWGAHHLQTGMHGFWHATFFYPTPRVTTFSDHLLGPAAVFAAFTALWPNPIAGYNLLLLVSFALTGWTTWYVFRRQGLPFLPAFLAGAMMAFSPFRWDQLSHPQLEMAALVPLVLWTFDRLLAEVTWGRAGLFLLFYGLHLSGGSYLAYMIHLPLAAFVAARLPRAERDRWLHRDGLKILLPTALAAGALAAAVFYPYAVTTRLLGLARHDEEMRSYGASALSFLTPSVRNLYGGLWPAALRRPENTLFAGLLPTALLAAAAGAAFLAWLRSRRSRPETHLSGGRRIALGTLLGLAALGYMLGDAQTWTYVPATLRAGWHLPHRGYNTAAFLLAAGLTGWVLLVRRWTGAWPLRLGARSPWERGLLLSALGCLLLAHPLAYIPLAKVVPGLSGMRASSRFYALASLSIAWWAARALWRLAGRIERPRRRALALGALTAALLVELAPLPLTWVKLPQERELPAVYPWLKEQPDVRALLELPFGDDTTTLQYLYAWTLHWKPLVNGYSGYVPESYQELRQHCCYPLPGKDVLAGLRAQGVSHILFHRQGVANEWEEKTLRRWVHGQIEGVELVYGDDEARVFRILPAGR